MKVIAFNGSPRVDGNTDILLTEVLKAVEESGHEIRLFRLNDMTIKPCQDCGGCDSTGNCIYDDDMSQIYTAIREADRVILASPVFFFALSAQAKTMVDRCQTFWCEKYLMKKPLPIGPYGRKGLFLMVGGMKRETGIQCGGETAKAFFRTISVPEHYVLTFLGIDAKGAILKHPTALKDAYAAGKTLCKLS
ncbi:MAG TPA: flavodoxin family protein [Thermodesulfovibrionales bacterium]|nr:flavodoxin family protein [Thermodesulfovibrionales bacterium]